MIKTILKPKNITAMNLKTQGFILIDVDVVALNNAGASTTTNNDNGVDTKKIYKNGRGFTYVSGQAWRYWWRETLKVNHNWQLSPITRESKIAFTEADPFTYADDDIFGYMRAARDTIKDENGDPVLDKKGNPSTENVTVTRVSPLKNSVLVSVASTSAVKLWSSMSRQEGDAVPYGKDEYSAIMKGMFSLDLFQAGTFSNINRTGFKNITDKIKQEAISSKGCIEINDPYNKDKTGASIKLVQLDRHTRLQRITDTIGALKTINGGAMQTNNMADVTPKFIILTTTSTGNHPFSHIVANKGINNELVYLNVAGIKEVLTDYAEQIKGDVFIGRRSGFLDEYQTELEQLASEFQHVKLLTINQAIDQYCEQLKQQVM